MKCLKCSIFKKVIQFAGFRFLLNEIESKFRPKALLPYQFVSFVNHPSKKDF
jgi:hypothetical protein